MLAITLALATSALVAAAPSRLAERATTTQNIDTTILNVRRSPFRPRSYVDCLPILISSHSTPLPLSISKELSTSKDSPRYASSTFLLNFHCY